MRSVHGSILCMALAAPLAAAAEVPAKVVEIVSVDDLKGRVQDWLVADVRGLKTFISAHIPHAFPLDLKNLEKAVLAESEPDFGAISRVFGTAPLTPHLPLVVYANRQGPRLDGYAAWLLAYAGLPHVRIFDGGFSAWVERPNLGVYMGMPIPRGAFLLRPGDLSPRPDLRIDPTTVLEGPPAGALLVDVVPARQLADPPAAPGSIAVNEVLDEAGLFLYPYHLRQLLQARGIDVDMRLLLRGAAGDQGLVWAALVANGLDAAMVRPLLQTGKPAPTP